MPQKAPAETGMPPLPPGFVLEQAAAMPPLPAGFVLENVPAAASQIGGGNTGVSTSPLLPPTPVLPPAPAVHGPNGAPVTNADQNPWQRFVEYPFMRGVNITARIADTAQVLAGIIDEDEYWRRIDAHDQAREAWPLHPDEQAGLDAIGSSDGWLDAAWQLVTHPNVVPGQVVESLVPSVGSTVLGTAAGLAGGAVGGPIGSAVGGVAGYGLGSFGTEFLRTTNEMFEEARPHIEGKPLGIVENAVQSLGAKVQLERIAERERQAGDFTQRLAGLPVPSGGMPRLGNLVAAAPKVSLDQMVDTLWPGNLTPHQRRNTRIIIGQELASAGVSVPADAIVLGGAVPFLDQSGVWAVRGPNGAVAPIPNGQTIRKGDGPYIVFLDGEWVSLDTWAARHKPEN